VATTRRQDLPDTFVGLLAWVIDDTGRTLRLIAIVGCVLFVLVLGITVGTRFAGAEGIRGIHPGYLLPAGITGAGSGLTWITILARDSVKKRRERLASAKKPPGTS